MRAQRRVSTVLLAVAWIAATLVGPRATAWQTDVHHDLTLWLAFKAGFSLTHARAVAKGNQSYDDRWDRAAVPLMTWVLLTDDVRTARDVQRRHFPSSGALPSPVTQRKVVPNDGAARKAALSAIKTTSARNALAVLGESLHPLQDSWSHAGVPDEPLRPRPRIRPELTMAHPKDRGGWSVHDADIAQKHVYEVRDAAHETYKLLGLFLENNPRYRHHAGAAWEELEPAVKSFAAAVDRTDWAKRYSTPGVTRSMRWLVRERPLHRLKVRLLTAPSRMPGVKPPKKLVRQAQDFVNAWFAEKNVDRAMTFVDWSLLQERNFKPSTETELDLEFDRPAVIQWCRTFMATHLMSDHELVDELGHADPTHAGYAELQEGVELSGKFAPSASIRPPKVRAAHLAAVGTDGDQFAMVLQVEERPRDAVGIVWQSVNDHWVIAEMYGIQD